MIQQLREIPLAQDLVHTHSHTVGKVQPSPAAKAECGAVVLAGGVTLSVSPSLACSPDRGKVYAVAGLLLLLGEAAIRSH